MTAKTVVGGKTIRTDQSPIPTSARRNPTTSDPDYTAQELQFMTRLDQYKRSEGRPFPTCSEVLAVLLSLGYRQVAEPGPIPTWPMVAQEGSTP